MNTVRRLSLADLLLLMLCIFLWFGTQFSWGAEPLPACRPIPAARAHPPGREVRVLEFPDLPPSARAWLAERGRGWREWIEREPAAVATALAIHHALSRTWIRLPEGERPFTDLLGPARCFEGDRVRARLDPVRFAAWLEAGAEFRLEREDGKEESGTLEFHSGSVLGGSLHDGYDIQGFTSRSRVPRLQINYRSDVSEADLDLDGRAPLKWGWLPNPAHRTWENSDVRHWFPRFLEKFGSPGFEVGD